MVKQKEVKMVSPMYIRILKKAVDKSPVEHMETHEYMNTLRGYIMHTYIHTTTHTTSATYKFY